MTRTGDSPERVVALLAIAAGSWLAERQFEGAYRYFGVVFAGTVYRDVYVLGRAAPAETAVRTEPRSSR